jgi:hypothetical protein
MTKHKFLRQRVFHDGTSMIVAKKGESHPVPAELLNDFVIDKSIERPKGWQHPDGDHAADDDDETGAGDGGAPAYSAKHRSGGKFIVTGPGLPDDGELVDGKAAAEARVAELNASPLGAGDGGAPTE